MFVLYIISGKHAVNFNAVTLFVNLSFLVSRIYVIQDDNIPTAIALWIHGQ